MANVRSCCTDSLCAPGDGCCCLWKGCFPKLVNPGGITKSEEERRWEFCGHTAERGTGTELSSSYTERAPG